MASTYLSKTFAQAGNRRTFTISYWIKMGQVSTGADQAIMGAAQDGSNSDDLYIHTGRLNFSGYYGSTAYIVRTSAKYKDLSGWYHHVIRFDSTQSTASDRVRLYVNGELQSALDENTYPSQNLETTYFNTARLHTIGSIAYGVPNLPFNGSMSHFHFCDGYSYGADSFGSTDATTGEWKINTSPSVSYGTNGFFILKDGNSVTDQSGQSNNWSVGGGTLTKTEDNPSNVFATWNPSYYAGGSVTHSAGNTRFAESGNYWKSTLATIGASTGKYYAEFKCNGNWMLAGVVDLNNTLEYGIVDRNFFSTTHISSQGYGIYNADGSLRYRGSETTYASTYGSGDILQVALDCDNNRVFFGIHGTWQNSAEPTSSGTGFAMNATNPIYTFACSVQNDEVHANFGNGYFNTTAVASAGTNASGNGIFEYDVPTGYTALSTKGLNL